MGLAAENIQDVVAGGGVELWAGSEWPQFNIPTAAPVASGAVARNTAAAELSSAAKPERCAVFLGASLIVLQILDGIFTSMGVSRFGLIMEGNPFLRHSMEQFGQIHTLAVLKSLAILVVIFLTYGTSRVSWLRQALAGLTCIYLFTAVLPWTYILFIRQYLA